MGIWSNLFGTENVVNKAVDGIYDGLDAAIYTNEEVARDRKELLSLYEPFKLAQRLIALTFCIPYMAAWSVTFFASFKYDVTSQVEMLLNPIGPASIIAIIVSFYFYGGVKKK
ncbi:hypothetical protein N9878_00735 [bacterium]|nr:hypothetical protein [bacterium]